MNARSAAVSGEVSAALAAAAAAVAGVRWFDGLIHVFVVDGDWVGRATAGFVLCEGLSAAAVKVVVCWWWWWWCWWWWWWWWSRGDGTGEHINSGSSKRHRC